MTPTVGTNALVAVEATSSARAARQTQGAVVQGRPGQAFVLGRHKHASRFSEIGRLTMNPEGPDPVTPTAQAADRRTICATVVAAAPLLMLAALAYHPYIVKLNNDGAVAGEIVANTTRWGLSHLAVGLAAAMLLLALLYVAGHLRETGEDFWTTLATPLMVVGSVLFAFLPAMEIAMLAVHNAGGDLEVILSEMNTWFVPILIASSAAFTLGIISLAIAINRSRVLGRWTQVAVAALLVMAAARFFPFGGALYVSGVAGIVALWPVAIHMWRSPHRPKPVDSQRESRSVISGQIRPGYPGSAEPGQGHP